MGQIISKGDYFSLIKTIKKSHLLVRASIIYQRDTKRLIQSS